MTGLVNETGTVVSNECVGPRLFIMVIDAPVICSRLLPGQFVHMKIPGMEDHILRRPFSVFRTGESTVEILYQVVGFGSDRMAGLAAGEEVEMIGPIGYGWQVDPDSRHALLVAGGVGAAPLYLHARALVEQGVDVKVVMGAQSADALVCRDAYRELLGCDPIIATDDGSLGHAGFCTAPAQEVLDSSPIDAMACCGPEPLMRIVAQMAQKSGVALQVSLERRMACGIGACLSCVVDTVEGKKRACVDGPVFNAEEVVW